MLFVTGDTHGSHDIDKLFQLRESVPGLTYDDFVIIAGDFGGVWSTDSFLYAMETYESLGYTILFVDGNHENFDLLEAFPVEEWNGGKVHRISNNVLHLMRGQVFTLQGKTVFTFGGADSTDKLMRTEGVSWWSREVPFEREYVEAHANLDKHNWKVDYIVTHTIDVRALHTPQLLKRFRGIFDMNERFTEWEERIDYGHWYFGHFHIDSNLTPKKTVLYQVVERLV